MKYKITFLSLVIVYSFSSMAIAQDELDYRKQTTVDLRNTVAMGLPAIADRMQEVTKGIDGTPYFNEEWAQGVALLPNDLKSKTAQMLYDTYEDQVYYKDDNKLLMLDKSRIEGFAIKMEDNWIIFKNGFNPGEKDLNNQTFFRVVHDGKTKILVHHYSYIRDSHKPAIATGSTSSKEFRNRDDYYLQTEDGQFYKVKAREKRIVRKLNKKFRDQVSDYADKNDLDFDEDKDLSKIMSFYDKLLADKKESN